MNDNDTPAPKTMTSFPIPRRARLAVPSALALVLSLVAGCQTGPAPVVGVMDVADRPAERALMSAMRAYDDADYPAVERNTDQALRLGLASPRDRATAHKLRAFVYCTSDRPRLCESEFRAARAADPKFELTKAEAGHPLWGPVYLKSRQ